MYHSEEIRALLEKLKSLQIENWTGYALTWRWNLLFAMLVLPWVVLPFILRKQHVKRVEYGLYTVLVVLVSSLLDQIGIGYALWSYPYKIIPAFSTFLPASFGILPVVFLLFYHFFNANPIRYYIAVALFSAVMAFGAQPLLSYWGMYTIYHWHYVYSFATTLLIAALCRIIAHTIAGIHPVSTLQEKVHVTMLNKRWFRRKAR